MLVLATLIMSTKVDPGATEIEKITQGRQDAPSAARIFVPTKDSLVRSRDMVSNEIQRMISGSLDAALIDDFQRCRKSYQASPFGSGGDEQAFRLCADVEDRRPLVELVLDDVAWQRTNSGKALDAIISEVTALPWQADQSLRARLIDALEKCSMWAQARPSQSAQYQGQVECTKPLAEVKTLLESAVAASLD